MKISAEPAVPTFSPFTLQIKVETLDELDMVRQAMTFLNYQAQVVQTLANRLPIQTFATGVKNELERRSR